MKTTWPSQVTSRQRAAVEEYVQRLLAEYNRRILSVTLFGSVARGDFTADSDIDILVLVDEASREFKKALRKLSYAISLEYNVLLSVQVKSRAHWERLCAEGDALWRNVERDSIELLPQFHLT
jgi:predicted nucleotidyltransferase